MGLAVSALLAGLPPGSARAEDPQEPEVKIDVALVYGSADEGPIDSELSSMRTFLEKQLPMHFGTLERLDSKQFALALGETAGFPLPSGSEVNVLPIAIVNGRLHLYLEMPGLNTRLQIANGRPVILGGPAYQNGHMLVELTTRFNPGSAPADTGAEEGDGDGDEATPPAQPRLERPEPPASRRAEAQPPKLDVEPVSAER